MYTIHNKPTVPPPVNQQQQCKRLKKQPQEVAVDSFCWFYFNKRTEEKTQVYTRIAPPIATSPSKTQNKDNHSGQRKVDVYYNNKQYIT